MKACNISHAVRLPCVFIISKYHPRIKNGAKQNRTTHNRGRRRNNKKGSTVILLAKLFFTVLCLVLHVTSLCYHSSTVAICHYSQHVAKPTVTILSWRFLCISTLSCSLEKAPWNTNCHDFIRMELLKWRTDQVNCKTTSELLKLVGVRIKCSR